MQSFQLHTFTLLRLNSIDYKESSDRENLDTDYQGAELVEHVAGFCNNTVVVTHSGGITLLPFADHLNVTAILAAHYPGQESGNSIVDVLYGDVNPSGHLPYTIALDEKDYNAPITTDIRTKGTEDWQSYFNERLEIDYRYFDAHDIDVRYEFGFGLSYTTFDMSNLIIEAENDSVEIPSFPEHRETQPGGNPALWETIYTAKVTLRNTGDILGAAVPQLYVTFPKSAPAGTPPRQLRGFDKIELGAGETGKATFKLMRRDLSYWDVNAQQWLFQKASSL